MSDNFDKLLKDKVNGFEAPLVHGDWGKMEQMLDAEKGAGWLPLFWAFVFGSLAIASLWLVPNDNTEQAGIRKDATVAFAEMNNTKDFKANFSLSANGTDEIFNAEQAALEQTITNEENSAEELESILTENSPGEKSAGEKNSPSPKTKKNKAVKNNSGNDGKTISSQRNKKNAGHFFANNQKTAQRKNSAESLIAFNRSNPFGKFPFIERELALALLNEDAFADMPDKVPATSSKKKHVAQSLISGAIGIEGGINESFFSQSSFTKPGYNVGITEELMFLKRIGISSSQSFSQVNYKTSETTCPAGILCPLEVSSTFRKLAVTIDIKVNLVNTPKWSYYIKAGIQNNFKLQETLNLEYAALPVPSDTTNPIPTIPNSFVANGTEADINGKSNSVPYSTQEGFSPFGEKKYYLAYHAATGFQYHLKKNFSLQMEAGYLISHRKPEYLGKRLQSLNMNVGVVYGFGSK